MRSSCSATPALALTLLLSACDTNSPTQAPPSPEPSPTPVASTIQWHIELINQAEAFFGVRIRLNGEAVYSNASLKRYHLVEVERPYVPGPHAIEFEILRATERRSTYKVALTVGVFPTGPWVHTDGVPTTLSVGQHYTVTFDPEEYAAEQTLAPDGALSAARASLETALRARFARTAPQVKRVLCERMGGEGHLPA